MSRGRRIAHASGVPLMQALVASGLHPALATIVTHIPHRYAAIAPRKTLREAGERREDVLIVCEGLLAQCAREEGGRQQIVAVHHPGELVLPEDRAADTGLVGIARGTVAVIARRDFNPAVEATPELARFFWKGMQRQLAIRDAWLVNVCRRDGAGRIVHLLCETAQRLGGPDSAGAVANPFTQAQIADMTGQTSVNVNRVFADLERRGILHREGRTIRCDDWPGLRASVGFDGAYLR